MQNALVQLLKNEIQKRDRHSPAVLVNIISLYNHQQP